MPQKASARPRPGLAPLDYGLYATSVLAWGLSWIALHYQVGTVAPEVSVVWRFAIAADARLRRLARRARGVHFG
jgi:hypothetical protein